MVTLIRERPPLRLDARIVTGGRAFRWAADERDPRNALTGITFSDTMPGGFEQASGTLARDPAVDYPDLAEFSTITICGAGGMVAWEGRLERTPRTSGDQMAISPGAVGWQAALDDDKSARMVYVDIQLGNWVGASVQRKLDLLGSTIDDEDPSTSTDPVSGYPSLATAITGAWARQHRCEAYYDANGIPLGSLYYAWMRDSNVSAVDPNWTWAPYLGSDMDTPVDTPGSLRAAGPGSGTLSAAGTRTAAMVYLDYSAAAGDDGKSYTIYWTCLGVYGNHNLTKRGTADYQNAQGFYPQDVAQHAVSTWAPKLATVRAGVSTINSTSAFVIPHLVFLQPTTASEILKEAGKYDLEDWAVWEGPTFYWNDYGARGRRWRARVGPSGLQETGPQVDRIYNSVVVRYTDTTGTNRTVGPPGVSANSTDATLADLDPANPATAAGLTRRAMLQMGTGTPASATKVGQSFLAQQKALSTAGQAKLVGHVEDDHGVLWPAWMVRAGDQISFTDAHDTSYRRVVKKSYSDQDRSATVDLDSPPQGLDALLARLSVALAPLGFS